MYLNKIYYENRIFNNLINDFGENFSQPHMKIINI